MARILNRSSRRSLLGPPGGGRSLLRKKRGRYYFSEEKRIMDLSIKEKRVKSILSKSGIPGVTYCVNPYVGCSHGCRYCYATFMKRFTGHREAWGTFVDAKVNAPEVLRRELKRAPGGHVMISSVTDPYQAAMEGKYKLTRQCLEALLHHDSSVGILTKSPLVIRDLDVIKKFREIEVGFTVTTDREEIRKTFEPHAPPIQARIEALKMLHEHGIRTYAFVGPVLPMNPELLAQELRPHVDSVLIDRMNYLSKTRKIYRLGKLDEWLDYDFVDEVLERLQAGFAGKEVCIC
jgi:DNA repair photolyase